MKQQLITIIMKITAKELNNGNQFSFVLNDDNYITLYKEGGVYFIIGFYKGSYFNFTADKLSGAKKIFNKNLKQIKTK